MKTNKGELKMEMEKIEHVCRSKRSQASKGDGDSVEGPWLVRLSWLSILFCAKKSLVWFPVRPHACAPKGRWFDSRHMPSLWVQSLVVMKIGGDEITHRWGVLSGQEVPFSSEIQGTAWRRAAEWRKPPSPDLCVHSEEGVNNDLLKLKGPREVSNLGDYSQGHRAASNLGPPLSLFLAMLRDEPWQTSNSASLPRVGLFLLGLCWRCSWFPAL